MSASDIGFCSKDMAARLARTQLQRSFELIPTLLHWPDLYGLSATATIVSHYKRRGDYRVHVGVVNAEDEASTLCFTFGKGFRERREEDAQVANLALAALVSCSGGGDEMGFGVVGEGGEEAVNAVGDTTDAGQTEVAPQLNPYGGTDGGTDGGADGGTNEGRWKLLVWGTGGEVSTVVMPDSRLPPGALMVFDGDIEMQYPAALKALDLERRGEGPGGGPIGKTWTRHQPPTFLLGGAGVDLEKGLKEGVFLTPDAEAGGAVFENWGVVTGAGGGEEVDGAVVQAIHKYKDAGANWFMKADTFADLAAGGFVDLLAQCARGGARFVLDCGGEEGLTECAEALAAEVTGVEAFYDIVDRVEVVGCKQTVEGDNYDDGSPSTMGGVRSVRQGDDVEDGFVVVKWDNGITYKGWVKEGRFHTVGAKGYSKGGGYRGSWEDGKRQGEGVSLYGGKFGYERWEGEFVDDKAHGVGFAELVGGGFETLEFDGGKVVKEEEGAGKKGEE